MRYVGDGVGGEVASDMTDISDAETGLALQIDVAVVLSLESGVSSLSTSPFK